MLLRVEHSSGYKNIELSRIHRQYKRNDRVDNISLIDQYEKYLKPKPPIILFDRDKWCSRATQTKYSQLVNNVIGDNQLIKVVKMEYRYDDN